MSTGPRHTYVPSSETPMDSEPAEVIDARFLAALAAIKRTRPFTIQGDARRPDGSAQEHSLSVNARFRRSLRE